MIFWYVRQYFVKTSRELKRLEGISRSPLFSTFSETLNGLQTIRAFKMQSEFRDQNRRAADHNSNIFFTYWVASRWLAIRMDWLSVLLIGVVTLCLVAVQGKIDPAFAGLALVYS